MKIDQDLLDFLNTRANIDTNPEQGNFQFDLTCEVDTSGNNGNGGQSGNNMQVILKCLTKVDKLLPWCTFEEPNSNVRVASQNYN